MSLNKCTDAELWEAICLDDRKAFDVLFERYWTSIYNTAFAYLKNGDAASQIVHDIFLNIWQKRHSYEIRSFKTYLTAAARYHVFKVLKSRKSENIVFVEHYSQLDSAGMTENQGAENIRTQELKKELEASLSELPKRCQQIFSLSRTSQLSNDEIAEKLNISKRTVENQLTVALQYLRGVLKFFPYQTRSR